MNITHDNVRNNINTYAAQNNGDRNERHIQ